MSGTHKLEYILMAEMQKTELQPEKDHWKLEYLKQAAGDLAELKNKSDADNDTITSLSAFKDTVVAELLNLRAELDDKERELDEWENAKKFVADGCKDEQHCGCVPILKRELDEARELLKEIHDCGGHMYEHSAPYRVYDKLDAWLASHPKDGEKKPPPHYPKEFDYNL